MFTKEISELKKSIMFQLSLSSKELFHSNFIAWLIENYKEAFVEILKGYIPIKNIVDVKRESKHRDIVVQFENNSGEHASLVIENKVKSIPDYEQLERYTTDDSNQYYLLLSLVKPSFVDNETKTIEVKGKEWIYFNYCQLATEIRDKILNIETEGYQTNAVNDYINFIDNLHNITDIVYEYVVEKEYNFYSQENKLIKDLEQIRLHDFYLKLVHHILESELKMSVKRKFNEISLVELKNWKKAEDKQCFTGSGFTNKSGITEIKYVVTKIEDVPVIVGIQLQGKQFRLFIETSKKYALKIAQELDRKELWFDFAMLNTVEQFDSVIYPTSKSSEFNTYSNEFYYKYVNTKNLTGLELISYILNYFERIIQTKSTIEEAIKSMFK